MDDLAPKNARPTWFSSTAVRAWRSYRRFLLIWLAFSVPFAAFRIGSGAVDPIPLTGVLTLLPLLGAAIYFGAFTYVATEDMRRTNAGFYLSWAVAGAVTLLVIGLVLIAGDLMSGGTEPLLTHPLFLPGIATLGAFTGAAYGWEARRMGFLRGPGDVEDAH